VTAGAVSPATLPPSGLPGVESNWSRLVETPDLDGVGRTWHVLDNQVADPTHTLLCVHGNPTWSYLWRHLIAAAPATVRVIAVDQLDMGYSERTGTTRRLDRRVDDLCALTDALNLCGPVVTVAHDWGGPISLGWAERHPDEIAGIVLMNTAVHQPAGSPAPALIRLVRTPGFLETMCTRTPAFIRGTMALAHPRLDGSVRAAYEEPYRTADRRRAIGEFVEDIPLDPGHPSSDALDRIASDLNQLSDVPALLLWGPSDPVFSDLYLRDLAERLPQAKIHRFVGAGHLTPEDADIAPAIYDWSAQLGGREASIESPQQRPPLWASLEDRSADDGIAIVEMGPDGPDAAVTFRELDADVKRVAAGLVEFGVETGDRVALLVPPGIDVAVCVYACWRIGAVVVVADAGLGVRGMSRALKSANPKYLLGIPRALAAARAMRWPGIRIAASPVSGARARALDVRTTLDDLRDLGTGRPVPPAPGPMDAAAIGFTSGATGPPKGVAYRHHQLQAQRDALIDLYAVNPDDRLVAAFGPFALYGLAMGIPSVVPNMEVTSPGSLTANSLAAAVRAIDATLLFASPAALRNIVATAGGMSVDDAVALEGVRLLMSAGAPVPAAVLRAAGEVLSGAEPRTPYGMTEVLPVADISLAEIDAAGEGDGVCVGRPLPGVDVAIDPLARNPEDTPALSTEAGVVGEVCIRAPHMRDGYDKLWLTEHVASQPEGWHRSGDVGHFDRDGRLWIEGRIGHIVTTPDGPVTPVGIEHEVSTITGIAAAAVVGVGPPGTQHVVVVVTPKPRPRRAGLADEALADKVRARITSTDVAAVLVAPALPVDKRHNSKIDRTRIARWAERVLAGGRIRRI
jgi:acyl-coenzyme A synthetase/AMP-(fatty) acid ligase/pimeloyl-ACP methyl ester carboxylesterase